MLHYYGIFILELLPEDVESYGYLIVDVVVNYLANFIFIYYYKNNKTTLILRDIMAEEKPIKCPKCGSTQLTATKKGFELAIGSIFTGGTGLFDESFGSGKVELTCLKCGHSWKPGKA